MSIDSMKQFSHSRTNKVSLTDFIEDLILKRKELLSNRPEKYNYKDNCKINFIDDMIEYISSNYISNQYYDNLMENLIRWRVEKRGKIENEEEK